MIGPLRRATTYAAVGFTGELMFSATHDLMRGSRVRLRTSPWMLPIYALIAPLYEPLQDAVRGRPVLERAFVYGAGTLAVEYTAGALLRRFRGEAPWDYSYTRFHLHGLIRPEYFLLWAAAGLTLERLHDRLTAAE